VVAATDPLTDYFRISSMSLTTNVSKAMMNMGMPITRTTKVLSFIQITSSLPRDAAKVI
jgi:hypothetical protein